MRENRPPVCDNCAPWLRPRPPIRHYPLRRRRARPRARRPRPVSLRSAECRRRSERLWQGGPWAWSRRAAANLKLTHYRAGGRIW